MRNISLKFSAAHALVAVFSIATSSLAQVDVPANLSVNAPLTTAGGSLNGQYWKRPPVSIPTDGATNPTNRIDNLLNGFGPPHATFRATKFVYLGNDLTHVTNWLSTDASSFVGTTNNLDDGVFRFSGFINVTNAGTLRLGTTSDDGSRITIAGIDIINNDGSHGDVTLDTNVNFVAEGLYPIEITFFNGDWTSDGTGDDLNHSGNPDPSVHGGANFHLRVAGADVTAARAGIFYSSAPVVAIPGKLAVSPPRTTGGGSLRGEYWKRPPVSIPTDGATNPTNRIDTLIKGFGTADGTFQATDFVYLGNDLTHVTNWLAGDAASFVGATNSLDDGAFRFTGFINVTNAGTLRLGTTSDDGSRITIAGIDVINNDGSHGDVTLDTNVNFSAEGLYPIEITFFNGDWTSDGTGDELNHSGNPDPSVHGGANFHLRVAGADVTAAGAGIFYSSAPVVAIPGKLAVGPPRTTAGGSLRGEYWKRPPVSIPTDGATNPTNRIDALIKGFGTADGTFQAADFVYLGNDLTHITNWLGADASSFDGATNNLDDGAFRFTGFLNVGIPGTVRLGTTSDDGSRITIGGLDVINNDGSHGDVTLDTNVVFTAAGLYPIEITFFNGDWTSDGTGDNLNHSGNPDPSVHGGANFHLRVAGADVTTNGAAMFFPAPAPGPTINVDFNTTAAASITYSGTAVAPDSGTTWNGVDIVPGATFTSGALVASDGLATPVTVSLGNFLSYNAAEKPADLATALLTDFAYQPQLGPGGPDSTFSINNLDPAAAYDLYLYAQNGGYARTVTIFTINGTSQYATNAGSITSFIQGTNYVLYPGLAPDASGVISGTFNVAKVADNAAFNGLQIVKALKPATNAPDITSVVISNGSITITWVNGGTLESSPSLDTPVWTPTGNSSGTFTEAVSATGNKFYRVKL